MSVPSKPQAVAKSKTVSPTSPVIVITEEDTKEIPDPFPFPATYSANVDVALYKGTDWLWLHFCTIKCDIQLS